MPIYEYQCNFCKYKFDELQKLSDPPFTVCPVCEKPELRKLIGAPALVFKGSGFYVNDYQKPEQQAKRGLSEAKE